MSETNGIQWIVLVAALGMMSTLMAAEVKELAHWNEILNPSFIGTLMGHFGSVIGAYIAGRLTPDNRNGKFTRDSDKLIKLSENGK